MVEGGGLRPIHRYPRRAEVEEMTDPAKVRRHAERIKELVAEVVRTQIKDPRVGMITITDARITADLRDATVFYTVFGDADEIASSAAALESAKGILRSEVGRRTGVRLTPTLEFVADAIPENAAHIEDLLRTAAARDADVAAAAAGASYAGDPDPYRHPDDGEQDEAADGGLAEDHRPGPG